MDSVITILNYREEEVEEGVVMQSHGVEERCYSHHRRYVATR